MIINIKITVIILRNTTSQGCNVLHDAYYVVMVATITIELRRNPHPPVVNKR